MPLTTPAVVCVGKKLQCCSAVQYVRTYFARNEDDVDIKHGMSAALNDLVSQEMIRNERPGYRGLRGTYTLQPSAIQAAGEALGLTPANIQMLQGVAPQKLKKR